MESNICSVLEKISGITEGMSKLRGVSVISEGGQVDKYEVEQLMIKNPDGLTEEEKEALAYAKIVLGEKEYAKLKNEAVFDNIATSPLTSGGVGSVDKGIATAIDKALGDGMSFNQIREKYNVTEEQVNETLKKLGYNREYRRNYLKNTLKEIGDIKPELSKPLKLAKGFGVVSTALAGVTAYEDCKNNDTGLHRAEAIGIDAVGTVGGYLAGGAIAGGAVSYLASEGASTVKGWFGLH
jgi:hypothetical protein